MGPRRRTKRQKITDDNDNDDVDSSDIDDDLNLVDVGNVRSVSHARQFSAVHSIFNKFLAFKFKNAEDPLYKKKYNDLKDTDITQSLFGMFVDYLLRGHRCVSESTAMNYISSMKGHIINDHNSMYAQYYQILLFPT